MHEIQRRLLDLSKSENLAKLSLREMAAKIGAKGEPPQKIKHHLQQLEKRGFLTINRVEKTMSRASDKPGWAMGLLESSSALFSIPILGSANCGVPNLFAEQNFQGFLKVSGRLIGRSHPKGLYAIRTDGSSMNRAEIQGRTIDDGDFVIVDDRQRSVRNGDIVVAIVDDKATIKEFLDDRANGQIVLRAKSSLDYQPIHLHPDDSFSIGGKVVAVIKQPTEASSID